MPDGLTYHAQGRQPRTALTVGLVWLGLMAVYVGLEASPVVIGIILLFTLPALWDLIANPAAGMRFDETGLTWHSGARTGDIPWDQIDHVRLDTRLDFSVRASIALTSGRRLRVPFEATPPHQRLEDALTARGVKVVRHHFSLLG